MLLQCKRVNPRGSAYELLKGGGDAHSGWRYFEAFKEFLVEGDDGLQVGKQEGDLVGFQG